MHRPKNFRNLILKYLEIRIKLEDSENSTKVYLKMNRVFFCSYAACELAFYDLPN